MAASAFLVGSQDGRATSATVRCCSFRCYTIGCISNDLTKQEIGIDLRDLHLYLRERNSFFIMSNQSSVYGLMTSLFRFFSRLRFSLSACLEVLSFMKH